MERSFVSLLIILGATIGGGMNAYLASNLDPVETTQIVHAAPQGLITTPLHDAKSVEAAATPTPEPATQRASRIVLPVNQTPTPAPAANGTTTVDNKDGIYVDGCELSGDNGRRNRDSCEGDDHCIVHNHRDSDVDCDEGRVR